MLDSLNDVVEVIDDFMHVDEPTIRNIIELNEAGLTVDEIVNFTRVPIHKVYDIIAKQNKCESQPAVAFKNCTFSKN